MRIFQCTTLYDGYLKRLKQLTANETSFASYRAKFISDRHGAAHFLKPILDDDALAFQANGNDDGHQKLWAKENGMRPGTSLTSILLAQIEQHRTEVFYCMDPVAYPTKFLKSLPSCVRKTIGWRAAPTGGADLSGYDIIVSNFPELLYDYQKSGCRVAEFYPAHDPVMDRFAARADRPIDVMFAGSYTRHHHDRSAMLEAVARLSDDISVSLFLDVSPKIEAASFIPLLPSRMKISANISKIRKEPLYGLALYDALSKSKIVINGSIDVSKVSRGNLRCFESMGCGSVLLTDRGTYPVGMQDGVTMFTYNEVDDALDRIRQIIADPERRKSVGQAAHSELSERYSKDVQMRKFVELVS